MLSIVPLLKASLIAAKSTLLDFSSGTFLLDARESRDLEPEKN